MAEDQSNAKLIKLAGKMSVAELRALGSRYGIVFEGLEPLRRKTSEVGRGTEERPGSPCVPPDADVDVGAHGSDLGSVVSGAPPD